MIIVRKEKRKYVKRRRDDRWKWSEIESERVGMCLNIGSKWGVMKMKETYRTAEVRVIKGEARSLLTKDKWVGRGIRWTKKWGDMQGVRAREGRGQGVRVTGGGRERMVLSEDVERMKWLYRVTFWPHSCAHFFRPCLVVLLPSLSFYPHALAFTW